jgi:2,3-bisphosphoglycerate-dependent phosphoglycerate mutase
VSTPIHIHLIRHGEAAQRWHEAPDPGLSAEGLVQAARVATRFQAQSPCQLITSPLLRAQQTALPLATAWQVTTTQDPSFREVPGPAELSARPAWIAGLMQAPWTAVDPEVRDWCDRTWRTLHALTEDTIIFTHFMVINAVVARIRNASQVVVFEPDYCSVTSLVRDNQSLQIRALGQSRATLVL